MEQSTYIAAEVKTYFLYGGYGEILSLIDSDILNLPSELLHELSNLNLDSDLDKILSKLNQLDQTNRFVFYFKDQALTYQIFKIKIQNLDFNEWTKLYIEYCNKLNNLMAVNPALRRIVRFIVDKIEAKIVEDGNLIGLLLTSSDIRIRELGKKICFQK